MHPVLFQNHLFIQLKSGVIYRRIKMASNHRRLRRRCRRRRLPFDISLHEIPVRVCNFICICVCVRLSALSHTRTRTRKRMKTSCSRKLPYYANAEQFVLLVSAGADVGSGWWLRLGGARTHNGASYWRQVIGCSHVLPA